MTKATTNDAGGIDDVPPAPPRTYSDQKVRLMSFLEIEAMPEMGWSIADYVPSAGLVLVFGPSGSFKTTLALSMALHVAVGEPWFGRPVRAGSALYICAEGVHGFSNRVRAWAGRRFNEVRAVLHRRLFVVGEALRVMNGEHEDLLQSIRRVPTLLTGDSRLSLVVIDTVARTLAGGDENTARDVGFLIDACDQIRHETGAAVVLIHHTGKDLRVERGSTALRAAADAVFRVSRRENSVTVRCEKQRDAPPTTDLSLEFETVTVGCHLGNRGPSSCRLRLTGEPPEDEPSHAYIDQDIARICETLRGEPFKDGATSTQLAQASGLARATLHRRLSVAVERGWVVRLGAGSGCRYALPPTDARGSSQSSHSESSHETNGQPFVSQRPSPLRGDAK